MILVISQDQWSIFARKHVSQVRKCGIWPKRGLRAHVSLSLWTHLQNQYLRQIDIITRTHLYWHLFLSLSPPPFFPFFHPPLQNSTWFFTLFPAIWEQNRCKTTQVKVFVSWHVWESKRKNVFYILIIMLGEKQPSLELRGFLCSHLDFFHLKGSQPLCNQGELNVPYSSI